MPNNKNDDQRQHILGSQAEQTIYVWHGKI